MNKMYLTKIIVLISLTLIAITLMYIQNTNAQQQKEINSEEFNELDGNILSIKIVDHDTIETNAKIYVKRNRTLRDVIEQFYDIKISSSDNIINIKDIQSNWDVFVNGESVSIDRYIPVNNDKILITNN